MDSSKPSGEFHSQKQALNPFVVTAEPQNMATHQTGSGGLTDQYSTIAIVASVVVGLLTIPVGLLIPVYFYFKADRGEGAQQSGLEVWTVILLGIFGIAAVEIGGRKGAKILWGLTVLVLLLFVALFATVLGGMAL